MPRRNEPWYWEARKGWYVKINGTRHNLDPDKSEAFRKFHELKAKAPEPISPDSVPAIIDEFLDWTKRKRAKETYKWYHKHCQSFVLHVGNLPLTRLKTHHIRKWIDSASVGDGTKNGMWRDINRAFSWAMKQEHTDRNPAKAVEKPGPQHREDLVTMDEYNKLMEVVKDKLFGDLLIVAWECGPRPEKILTVEARHFELDKGRWYFPPVEGKKERLIS